MDEFLERPNRLVISVSSPRRLAEVRYSGADRMEVRLAQGVLSRPGLTESELLDDVRRAVADASEAFDERYRQIRRDHYERGLWKQEERWATPKSARTPMDRPTTR